MLSLPKTKTHIWLVVLMLAYTIFSCWTMKNYLSSSVLELVLVFAYVFFVPFEESRNIRYTNLTISFIFILLYAYFGSTSFLFFSLIFLCSEVLAIYKGRLPSNFYFLVFICSPLFSFLAKVLGFPLRLILTKFSTALIAHLTNTITQQGNTLFIDGHEFFVDEGCSGLHMLFASFIWAVLLIEYFSVHTKKQASFTCLVFIYFTTAILNIMSNVSRICLVLLCKIYPDSINHEMVGMICFLIYALLPSYVIIRYIFNKIKSKNQIIQDHKISTSAYKLIFTLIVVSFLLQFTFYNKKTAHNIACPVTLNASYNKTFAKKDVIKFEAQDKLIYVKPIHSYLSGEHTPLICWEGSGYSIQQFKETNFQQHTIYTGELVKGNDKLITAWYYTDGKTITNSQWVWRTEACLHNKNFYLVNVTAPNKQKLYEALHEIVWQH